MNRIAKSLLVGTAAFALAAGVGIPMQFSQAQYEALAPDSAVENIFEERLAPEKALENIFEERLAPPSAVENIFEAPQPPEVPPPPPPGPGAILVIKFKDLNGNAVEDAGEPRMSGVTFSLSNGASGSTDFNGTLFFGDLKIGSYTITESVPSGFTVTTPNPQTANVVSDQTVTLKFGNKPVVVPTGVSGAIQIIKFKDFNGDCVLNTGEPFMGGVTFVLTIENWVLGNKVTDQNGHAEFRELDPGTYTVREDVPVGFTATCPNPTTITLREGETRNLFFGNKPVTVPVVPPPGPQPTPPAAAPIKELPKSGVAEVLFPGASALLVTLYSMVKRQRRDLVTLAKHLV